MLEAGRKAAARISDGELPAAMSMALHSCVSFCCPADEEALSQELALLVDRIIFVSTTGRFYGLMGLL